jgi:hypothetical protein
MGPRATQFLYFSSRVALRVVYLQDNLICSLTYYLILACLQTSSATRVVQASLLSPTIYFLRNHIHYTIHLIKCGLIIDVNVDQEVHECHLISGC